MVDDRAGAAEKAEVEAGASCAKTKAGGFPSSFVGVGPFGLPGEASVIEVSSQPVPEVSAGGFCAGGADEAGAASGWPKENEMGVVEEGAVLPKEKGCVVAVVEPKKEEEKGAG